MLRLTLVEQPSEQEQLASQLLDIFREGLSCFPGVMVTPTHVRMDLALLGKYIRLHSSELESEDESDDDSEDDDSEDEGDDDSEDDDDDKDDDCNFVINVDFNFMKIAGALQSSSREKEAGDLFFKGTDPDFVEHEAVGIFDLRRSRIALKRDAKNPRNGITLSRYALFAGVRQQLMSSDYLNTFSKALIDKVNEYENNDEKGRRARKLKDILSSRDKLMQLIGDKNNPLDTPAERALWDGPVQALILGKLWKNKAHMYNQKISKSRLSFQRKRFSMKTVNMHLKNLFGDNMPFAKDDKKKLKAIFYLYDWIAVVSFYKTYIECESKAYIRAKVEDIV